MKYLVAVSGGIDSVVLLDMLVRANEHTLVVAHFDHGMRPDSAADARFVEALAKEYGLPFVTKHETLGETASEATARAHRYAFLHEEAKKIDATIVTAHHLNDLVESITINLQRGTGWQGLAVLNRPGVTRPLLSKAKSELYEYALKNRLEWVEDSTNSQSKYLRNRVRKVTTSLRNKTLIQLWDLRDKQVRLRQTINEESEKFLASDASYERYFFIMVTADVALELLRRIVERVTNKAPTRPQTERALMAIKTAQAGSVVDVGEGVTLRFTTTKFIVTGGPKVLS